MPRNLDSRVVFRYRPLMRLDVSRRGLTTQAESLLLVSDSSCVAIRVGLIDVI
jgi:hypothetical protein